MDLFCQIFPKKARVYKILPKYLKVFTIHDKIGLIRRMKTKFSIMKGNGMNTDDTVTIYDVAREAGVSMATVSRVVNGNKNVKENTRKKFWK